MNYRLYVLVLYLEAALPFIIQQIMNPPALYDFNHMSSTPGFNFCIYISAFLMNKDVQNSKIQRIPDEIRVYQNQV